MADRDDVRDRISRNRLTHTWVIYQLQKRGIETNRSQFSGAVSGALRGEKITEIINKANEVLDDYERYFVKRVAQKETNGN